MQEKGCSGFVRHGMEVHFIFWLVLIKDLLVRTVFASYSFKLSLPMFLKCFLIFNEFQPHVSNRHVSYKNVYSISFVRWLRNHNLSYKTSNAILLYSLFISKWSMNRTTALAFLTRGRLCPFSVYWHVMYFLLLA